MQKMRELARNLQSLPVDGRHNFCTQLLESASLEHVVHELRHPSNTELLPARMAALDTGREKVRDVVRSAERYIAAFRCLQRMSVGEKPTTGEREALVVCCRWQETKSTVCKNTCNEVVQIESTKYATHYACSCIRIQL